MPSNAAFEGATADVLSLEDHRATTKTLTPTGGGGTGGGPTVDTETKNYVDANVRAAKAENDAKFTEVLSKLDSVSSKVDAIPKPLGFWQIAGMGATGVLALITIFGVMADRFDGGISAFGVIDTAVEAQRERDLEQDARLERLLGLLEERGVNPDPSPHNQD